MKRYISLPILFFCAISMILFSAACASAPAEAAPDPTPTAAPTAEPTATPTATPVADPTASPDSAMEITVELETMYPLLKAHTLAQLNGSSFNPNDPEYFWQTIAFAIDGCGMDFYTSETMGSALVLSRGVIEEIASGLFEGGGSVLLEIPETLGGEIVYDQEADAFAHPLSEGSFTIIPTALTENGDGSLTLTANFFAAGDEENPITAFTAELVPNTRDGNSLFMLSVRDLRLIS